MAAIAGVNSNTAAQLQAQTVPVEFLPQMWKKGADLSEQGEDFFEEFEGKGMQSPIRVETDFNKDGGQTINFRTISGLYYDGVRGDTLIGDDGEPWRVGAYQMTVDYIRHMTRRNQRTEDFTAMKSEIADFVPEALGAWMGRKKTKDMSMMLRHRLHATSLVIADVSAGPKVDYHSLKSVDVITMNGVIGWGQQLKTMGGLPALFGKTVDKNPIKGYIVLATGEALVSLKTADDWKQAQREAGVRGDDNVIFRGAYQRIDGHVIREWNPLDHDGRGAIGSALNPKAILGKDIAAGTAAVDITGGGPDNVLANLTAPKYFEHFSNYQYKFADGTITSGPARPLDLTLDWGGAATVRYCLIYNVTGADAGKMGFYQFTLNDGNKLTMTARLGSAAAGIRALTVGNVTYNVGPWVLGKLTEVHPSGSIVIETNSYGVPFGYSFVLGAQAAMRGYGRFRNHRSEQIHEGGFVKDVFITSVLGQTPKQRVDGRTPNILRVLHAIKYAGLNIPTVT
jgi:hypothetical protein